MKLPLSICTDHIDIDVVYHSCKTSKVLGDDWGDFMFGRALSPIRLRFLSFFPFSSLFLLLILLCGTWLEKNYWILYICFTTSKNKITSWVSWNGIQLNNFTPPYAVKKANSMHNLWNVIIFFYNRNEFDQGEKKKSNLESLNKFYRWGIVVHSIILLDTALVVINCFRFTNHEKTLECSHQRHK